LAVLDAAHDLQEDLQRAAATAGRDETAAAALVAINDFRSEKVGLDRANSRKPLRTANTARARATGALHEAERSHKGYLKLVAEAEAASEAAERARQDRELAGIRKDTADKLARAAGEARLATEAAEQATLVAETAAERRRDQVRRLTRAKQLSEVLRDRQPISSAEDDILRSRLPLPLLAGRTPLKSRLCVAPLRLSSRPR